MYFFMRPKINWLLINKPKFDVNKNYCFNSKNYCHLCMLKYLWTTRFQILKRFFCEFLENFCRIILIENFSKKNVWKCMVLKSFRFSYYIDAMLLYHNTLFHCAKILYFYPKIYRGKSNFRVKISVTNVNFSTKYRKFCHFVQYHLLAFRHVERMFLQ